MQRRQERSIQSQTPGTPNRDTDGNDLASAASWVAAEIVERAMDAGLAISQHEAYGSEMAEDARLPSSFLLASAVVAVPALVDAHVAAQAELSMPGPKVFMCNALVLVGSAVAFWIWVCIVTARLLPADADLSEVWVLAWVQGMPAAAWTSYQQQLASEPVLVKALLTGWTYIVGDMIAQIVQQTHEVAPPTPYAPSPSPSPSPSPNPYPDPNPDPNPSPNQAAVLEAQRISELDALLPHLERIHQWDVDVFALWEASENMGLVVGTYHLLEQHNLVSKFRLSKPRLMTFLAKMQEGYR